ncbi:DNA-binding transcriptional regulator, AcrR family [Chryseobacterium arachidis]|uniref:DNA-binding transcriptional regulator, AcrR family n=1 Tax=Chryseobacterium arachidis TaxID=1416778 RepID=A0A1M5MFK3_9FLAO|nr:TetR/AcrR family transcriptional regulator [Chryseobacterium arachidis]SHG76001.1 DNA-binding transcriptional regulator, AcrR family [Chryseobacterium arachidis]
MSDTENKIKAATVDLLLKEGNFGFTLYDVAERSKASRTVIHYYFRSRDNLQAIVTKEILNILVQPRYETLISKDNLKSKILNFLEESDKICRLYPYIDVFLMVRLKVSNDLQKYFQDVLDSFKDLISEVQEAIDRKEVNYPDAQVFLSDLFSLSSFSYIFSNFFRSLDLPVHRKSIFDDCKNKNERILDILFGRN